MRVILGSGKVASVIKQPGDVVLGHDLIEITDADSVFEALSSVPRGTTVINTVAKINLEWCETNQEEATRVNFEGAQNVLRACRTLDMPLCHISSGSIFDGGLTGRIFHEWDIPNPACHYAKTKAEADLWLLSQCYPRLTIVRPRQLFSSVPSPTNMITKFAKMKTGGFISVPQSATCIEDLGSMISHLMRGGHHGVFNCVNEGAITPLTMAKIISHDLMLALKPEPVEYEDFLKTVSVKRVNTLLSTSRLRSTGFRPRAVNEAFDWAIENYF